MSFFSSLFRKSEFKPHNFNWSIADYVQIADKEIRKSIKENGFYKSTKLKDETILELLNIFKEEHNFDQNVGGMFYSVYSQDIEYRKRIHHKIQKVIQPIYNEIFTDYKSVINSFIVKTKGAGSEFEIHQDSTGLNEWKYSPISVWIPLQDTNAQNGCLWVVPKSHLFTSPYRGISFPSVFEGMEDTIIDYLQPIELKKGEVLLFDNRLIHTSSENFSSNNRIVLMSGIFPKEAKIISCYMDHPNSNVLEIFEQNEKFLLENKNFFENCTSRPYLGKVKSTLKQNLVSFNKLDLISFLKRNKISSSKTFPKAKKRCEIISEPKSL